MPATTKRAWSARSRPGKVRGQRACAAGRASPCPPASGSSLCPPASGSSPWHVSTATDRQRTRREEPIAGDRDAGGGPAAQLVEVAAGSDPVLGHRLITPVGIVQMDRSRGFAVGQSQRDLFHFVRGRTAVPVEDVEQDHGISGRQVGQVPGAIAMSVVLVMRQVREA